MWGLLSNKDGAQEGAVPPAADPSAPPPMMFNPLTTNTAVKPRNNRNPLSKPKRPTASGLMTNQAQSQNQPLSPTGQPLSPFGQNSDVAQSPTSPSAKQSFNAFPNFNSADEQAQETNSGVNQQTGVNEYLSDYTYGNGHANNQNDIVSNNENKQIPAENNDYQQAQYVGDSHQYGSHENHEGPVSHEQLQSEDSQQAHKPQDVSQQEEPQQQVIYETEEQYNYAYYQYYGTNPPAEEWEGYRQQWVTYRSGNDQARQGAYQEEAVPQQQAITQQQAPQYAEPAPAAQSQPQIHPQQPTQEPPQPVENQPVMQPSKYDQQQIYSSQQSEFQHRTSSQEPEFQHRTYSPQQREYSNQGPAQQEQGHKDRYESYTSSDSNRHEQAACHQSESSLSEYRDRHGSGTDRLDSQSSSRQHNSESFSAQQDLSQFPEGGTSFFNNMENVEKSTPTVKSDPANAFFDQVPPEPSILPPNNSVDFFSQPVAQECNKNDIPDNQAPRKTSESKLATPDNQYQKERDSTTPLWEKRDLHLDQQPPLQNPLSPLQNPLSPRSFARQDSLGEGGSRSRHSSSTVTGDPRTRNPSSTSRSEPRSRTTSSNSYLTEVVDPPPPPQFNDFPPQPFIQPAVPSAFAPVNMTNNSRPFDNVPSDFAPNTIHNYNRDPDPKFNLGSTSEESIPSPRKQLFIPSQESVARTEHKPDSQQTRQPFDRPFTQSFQPASQIQPNFATLPSADNHVKASLSMQGPLSPPQAAPPPLAPQQMAPPQMAPQQMAPQMAPTQVTPQQTVPPHMALPPFSIPSQHQPVVLPSLNGGNRPSHSSFSAPNVQSIPLPTNSSFQQEQSGLSNRSNYPTNNNPVASISHQPRQQPAAYREESELMPPPSMYDRINLSSRGRNPGPPMHNSNAQITFARPISSGGSDSMSSSRPPSRGSDDTISKLRKEYEERKILRRGTPDSIGNVSGEGLGTPLMNSTANNSLKKLNTLSMKSLRNMSSSAASIIAAQEAYENVMLRTKPEPEGQSYENHELPTTAKRPPLPSRSTLPPRASRKDTSRGSRDRSRDSSRDRREGKSTQDPHGSFHRRNNSTGSGTSLKSDVMSRSRYGNERETTSREDTRSSYGGRQDIRRDMRDPRDVRDPTRDMPRDPRDRDVDPRDPRYSTRSHEHDKRYYYEQRRKREWEMYHTRGGPHPEDPYRGYRDPRAYTGYGREVYDRRNYYADRLYDRSDEISISHSESVRSETVSHSVNNNESHEPATSTDPLKESTDTDALISSSDSKCNLLDDSQDLGSEEDPSQIEESIEEEEVVEESTALADMYTEPYLYTQPHVRARCFGPNRFACVLPNDETDKSAPHIVEISDFKLLYWQELKEIEEYPGPFIKGETPKRDVTNYCKKQASLLRKNNCFDEGKILLWELLALFCKQNGVVIGTDVAELLLADQETTTIYSTSQIGGFNKEGQAIAVTEEQKTEAIQQIRECLFEGQRKEALEVSVKYCLWELAFTISTTLSSDILSSTLQRFASSLHTDDPLKSFHQLISSTEPSACADVTKWRQHLAMLLSNQSDRYDPNFNYILTLANTLASASMVYASHFACLMSGSKLTSVLDKTSPLALLGLDHTKDSITRLPYAPIQLTEIYEYSKILGGEPCIVSFQGVKLYYAKEVAKVGHYSKSLQYLQQISNNINMAPKSYRARFIQRVYDECIKTVQLLGRSLPDWVEHLRETLKNRELGISNRSTAYSSRVATPDIQRVAQYLLHRQKPAAVTSQLVQESAHTAQNVQSQPQQQPVAQPHIDTHQAATPQSSEPVSEDTSQSLDPSSQSLDPTSQSLDATSGPVDPANQHQELLNNGYSWDGQLYRHESYPGYCLYEGQWYPDPHYQQPVEEQQDHVAHQQNHVTHQPSEQTETDGAGETSGVAQGKEGYSPTEYLTPRREPGTLEYPADNSYDEFRTPRATETSPQQDSLTEMNRDTYKHDAFSRHRQDTLTADDQIDTADYNQSNSALPESSSALPESTETTTDQSPAAPAFTFFNPAQFGGGSVSMLAPMVPLSGSSNPDQPLSEDEIKTPTNDEPKDPAGGPQKKKKQVLPGEEENAAPVKKEEPKKSSGIFSRLFKGSGNKRMILPDDSKPTIYWDENLGKYVDTSKESDEEDEAPPPPPTNSLPASLPPSSRSSLSGGSEEFAQSAPGSPGGSFRRKPGRGRLGGANRYVDVMAGSGMKKSATTPNFS